MTVAVTEPLGFGVLHVNGSVSNGQTSRYKRKKPRENVCAS